MFHCFLDDIASDVRSDGGLGDFVLYVDSTENCNIVRNRIELLITCDTWNIGCILFDMSCLSIETFC